MIKGELPLPEALQRIEQAPLVKDLWELMTKTTRLERSLLAIIAEEKDGIPLKELVRKSGKSYSTIADHTDRLRFKGIVRKVRSRGEAKIIVSKNYRAIAPLLARKDEEVKNFLAYLEGLSLLNKFKVKKDVKKQVMEGSFAFVEDKITSLLQELSVPQKSRA